MDLKHVVPDMEKTFGRLTFGGEGEAEVTRGRNSRPLSRTYNLFSDVQRADDISVKITGNVGQHAFEFMEEVELVNPKIVATGKNINGFGWNLHGVYGVNKKGNKQSYAYFFEFRVSICIFSRVYCLCS